VTREGFAIDSLKEKKINHQDHEAHEDAATALSSCSSFFLRVLHVKNFPAAAGIERWIPAFAG
jgi:hypothetical protein